jgi:uncharacterized membrane protein required for colicin V production
MFIIADLIVIAVLILCTYVGYKRGLTNSLIRILSFAIAVCIAFMFFKPISNIVIDNTNYDENIQTSIVQIFEKEETSDEKKEDQSPILERISNEAEKATEEKKNEIIKASAEKVSRNIICVLVFLGLFIIARIAVSFIKALTNLLTRLPLIKQCDKIGGVIYGILEGLLILFIALALITFISTISNNYEVMEIINNSYIAKYLNDYNILLNIIF